PFVARHLPVWKSKVEQRRRAAYWLAQIGPKATNAVPALSAAAASDPNPELRCVAIWALSRINGDSVRSVAVLTTTLLGDRAPETRRAAAGALEVWQPFAAKAVPALIAGLSDSDPVVRQVCAAALGKYGTQARAAIGMLQTLATKQDEAAADYAA